MGQRISRRLILKSNGEIQSIIATLCVMGTYGKFVFRQEGCFYLAKECVLFKDLI